jgi:conjugal transfer pilus assembly protein TraD
VGTRLALLSESSAGRFLTGGDPAREIDLGTALEGGDVVLFSLNSSVYGKLAAQLGGLAIQDVVSATGRRLDRGGEVREALPQATVAIDEFSALGADNILALLARGREAGVSAIVATQELTDLERAAPGFRDQVLGIVAVKIFHRQDVPASAHTVAQMTGTERVWERTEQIRSPLGPPGSSLGTRRQVERFIVDPNEIKTLRTGQAVIVSKTPSTRIARVRVTPPRVVTGPAAHPPARGVSGAGRDQPAPGVTR